MNIIKKAKKHAMLAFKNAVTGAGRYGIEEYRQTENIREGSTYYLVRPVYGIQLRDDLFGMFQDYFYDTYYIRTRVPLKNYEYCIKKDSAGGFCRIKIPELTEVKIVSILNSCVAVIGCGEDYDKRAYYVPLPALYGACPYAGKTQARLTVYGPHGGMLWDSKSASVSHIYYSDSINDYRNTIYVSIVSLFLYTKDGCAKSFAHGVRDAFDDFYNTIASLKSENSSGGITNEQADRCIRKATKSLAGFMKELLASVSGIDGFCMYDGPDVFDLFECHAQKEDWEAQEKKKAEEHAEHTVDSFVKHLESRNDLLKQFNESRPVFPK